MSSDDTKKSLILIPTPENLQPRNFWNTAGLSKEFFPTEPRPDSIPILNKQGRVIQEPIDEWWINSKDHHFCFWTFIQANSQQDGTMEPLLQSEIAELFGCSSTKVHFMLKEAMDRLTSEENMQILQNLFELTAEEPSEDMVPFSAISQLDQLDDNEDEE